MHPAFYALFYAQGLVALLVALYGTYVWLWSDEDIVTRYLMRAGTVAYMCMFLTCLPIAAVPA